MGKQRKRIVNVRLACITEMIEKPQKDGGEEVLRNGRIIQNDRAENQRYRISG